MTQYFKVKDLPTFHSNSWLNKNLQFYNTWHRFYLPLPLITLTGWVSESERVGKSQFFPGYFQIKWRKNSAQGVEYKKLWKPGVIIDYVPCHTEQNSFYREIESDRNKRVELRDWDWLLITAKIADISYQWVCPLPLSLTQPGSSGLIWFFGPVYFQFCLN